MCQAYKKIDVFVRARLIKTEKQGPQRPTASSFFIHGACLHNAISIGNSFCLSLPIFIVLTFFFVSGYMNAQKEMM